MITPKNRTLAKSESGKLVCVQTIRNILHIMAASPKENNTSARLTGGSQFSMANNMKTIAMNSGEHLFSQMKRNLCFLSQVDKKKYGGERTVN